MIEGRLVLNIKNTAVYLRVDFQVQLTHPWDDGFFALCVIVNSESWIFSGEPVDTFGEFVQVILSRYKTAESYKYI